MLGCLGLGPGQNSLLENEWRVYPLNMCFVEYNHYFPFGAEKAYFQGLCYVTFREGVVHGSL